MESNMAKKKTAISRFFMLIVLFLLLWAAKDWVERVWQHTNNLHNETESVEKLLNLEKGTRIIEVNSSSTDYLQTIYDQVDEAVRNQESQICIVDQTEIDWSTFGAAQGYPYFWVKNVSVSRSWKSQDEETKHYDVYTFTYQEDVDEREDMQKKIDQAAQRILSQIPTDADQWEACKIIHDELCKRIGYDDSKLKEHGHDIYGALVEGSAVCQGYTYSFAYLLKQWGINSAEVSNDTHDWNELYILSCSAFVDVTWDDLDAEDSFGRPYIIYDYFGLTKEEMNQVESHETTDETGRTVIGADSEIVFNYHEHEGCYFTTYNYDNIKNTFRTQFQAGGNMLTVKFANEAAYQQAKAQLLANNGEGLGKLLGEIGYIGQFQYWQQDDLYILDIGLYAKSEE
jgi:hypothetical protein